MRTHSAEKKLNEIPRSVMPVDIPGLVGLIVFYVIILVVGLVVGRKYGKSSTSDTQFLANRDLGLFVASCTLSGEITNFYQVSRAK